MPYIVLRVDHDEGDAAKIEAEELNRRHFGDEGIGEGLRGAIDVSFCAPSIYLDRTCAVGLTLFQARWYMPIVSVTRLRVRSWRFAPAFLFTALRIAAQARNAEGSLGAKIFRDARNTFWTCTCWDSEASLRAFMIAKPHGPAMHKLLRWCDEAALAHWTQESIDLPSWTEAHERMLREGRRSKVNHPSEAHKAFHIDAPGTSAKGEVRVK